MKSIILEHYLSFNFFINKCFSSLSSKTSIPKAFCLFLSCNETYFCPVSIYSSTQDGDIALILYMDIFLCGTLFIEDPQDGAVFSEMSPCTYLSLFHIVGLTWSRDMLVSAESSCLCR